MELQLPDDTDMMSIMNLGKMRKVMDEVQDALKGVPEEQSFAVGRIIRKHFEKDYLPVKFVVGMLSINKTKQ